MRKAFEAVYEDGILRPLEALDLADRQRVPVAIVAATDEASDISAYFEPEEWEAAKHDQISLDEVRRALSSIQGSLSDAVIASRNERF